MNSADLARQNGVGVNVASHQIRQRATVRRSTPIASASFPRRRSLNPLRIAEIKVTIVAR